MAAQTVILRDGPTSGDTQLAELEVYRLSQEPYLLPLEPFTQAESNTQSSKGQGVGGYYEARTLEFEVFVPMATDAEGIPTQLLALRDDVQATERLESLNRYLLIDAGVGIRSWRRAAVPKQDGEKETRDGFVARVVFIATDARHVWTAFNTLTSPADDGIGVL